MSVVLALLLSEQQVLNRTFDVNGRPVSGVQVSTAEHSQTTTVRNVNGREVPVETVEERVISDGIVERTVRRFDPSGAAGPVERIRIETRNSPDGTVETITTVSRADLNGHVSPVERRSALSRKSGDNTDMVETVERPSVSGGFQVSERMHSAVRPKGTGSTTETTVVERPDANGRFHEAGRTVTERSAKTENRVEYEAAGSGMQLVKQTITRSEGDRTETDVFLPGLQGQPQLSRREMRENTRSGSGVTSVLNVQLTDGSGRLTAPRVAEETTCKGNCEPKTSAIIK